MNKSYYAIIPANIRYDNDITPNAKLLYGEITALCNEKGYCWASNSYFAELYGASNKSVSRWIAQLIKKGYLYSEMIYKESGEIEKRYLYITIPKKDESKDTEGMDKNVHRYGQECSKGMDKNVHRGMDKNVADNTTSTNTTNNTTVYSTTQNAVVNTNIKLIQEKTHLKLTNNMKKIASSWNDDKLIKAINIFLDKDGEYFSLLEKIYKNDGNFKEKNTHKGYKSKKTKFHNFKESFGQYTSDELDEIIRKSQKAKFG